MQSVLARIWTCVTVSISYDDNHYTTGTSYDLNFCSFLTIITISLKVPLKCKICIGICRMPHIHQSIAQGLFYDGNQAQDCSPHMSFGSKNALGSVGIPLKKGHLKHQAINLAPPRISKNLGRWPPEASGIVGLTHVPVTHIRQSWQTTTTTPNYTLHNQDPRIQKVK